jgi:tetrahydromethanopterin S-methyltransferase subunit C
MQQTSAWQKIPIMRQAPRELAYVAALAVALLAVIAGGMMISAALPDQSSDWMFGAAYLAPASLAFTAYWWISQRRS